jgi:hypothetical protein
MQATSNKLIFLPILLLLPKIIFILRELVSELSVIIIHYRAMRARKARVECEEDLFVDVTNKCPHKANVRKAKFSFF